MVSLLRTAGKFVALALLIAWSVLPLAVIVIGSLKIGRDIFAFPPTLIFQPTLDNYVALFRDWPAFADAIKNSLIVSVGSTLATVVLCLFAGYGYARYEGRLLRASEVFLVGIRMLPPIVITVPLFPAVNWLNLTDTRLVLVIIYTTFYVSLGTLIMKAFIAQVPRELDDAARVDGAGTFQIVTRIIAPIAMSGLIAVGIFVFIYAWNEFIFAFIFTSTEARTGPLMVSEMLGALDGIRWGVVFAAVTLQVAPILLLVSLAQRYIISGLTSGSVKG